jgi:hypothetical protein
MPFLGYSTTVSAGAFIGYGKLGVGASYQNGLPPTYLLGVQIH